VGGLYGVSLGAIFFGESMFARAPDASKITFVTLVPDLQRRGIELIDCQVYTIISRASGRWSGPRDATCARSRSACGVRPRVAAGGTKKTRPPPAVRIRPNPWR
jgi:leucyl/phenylalanyl-tRNA--protein transferase